MKIKILYFILLFTFISSELIFSQQARLNSLGGLSYSIIDEDSQIDIFQFGNNPAWLLNSKQNGFLEITPYYSNDWGNYSRKFAPEGTLNYGSDFIALYNLGSSGTFRGYSNYNYQMKRNNHRALTLSPYSGEAFFFTDTTDGNFTYSGPTIGFIHNLEVFENLYLGVEGNYQILDGLKDIYTYAITLYRNVSGKIGLAYKINNNLSIGLDYNYTNSQERIEANDVNLLSIQTYLWRGETYKIELRGSTQNFKINKDGNSFSGQLAWKTEELQLGFLARYSIDNTYFLYPRGTTIEFEDGFSNFGTIDITTKGRYKVTKDFIFGFTGGYFHKNSWSKNSNRELLLWEWNYKDKFIGIGSSINFDENLLFAYEYEAHFIESDSTKYIDSKYEKINTLAHSVKLGFEIKATDKISIQSGYNFLYSEYDLVTGGKNFFAHEISLGSIIKYSEKFHFIPSINYLLSNTENNFYRDGINISFNLKFLY